MVTICRKKQPPRRPRSRGAVGSRGTGRARRPGHGPGAPSRPPPSTTERCAWSPDRCSLGRLPCRRPRIGIERRAQPAHRVMKSRSDRPGRDAERFGDAVERPCRGSGARPPPRDGRWRAVGSHVRAGLDRRPCSNHPPASAHPRGAGACSASIDEPASLGVAGAHEEPVRPGVEARRVAKLREVTPDGEQRLLRRVLGEIDVAQNSVRDRMKPIPSGDGEAREGLFVAVLCSSHEIGIHASSVRAGRCSAGQPHGMGGSVEGRTQSSVAAQTVRRTRDAGRRTSSARRSARDQ